MGSAKKLKKFHDQILSWSFCEFCLIFCIGLSKPRFSGSQEVETKSLVASSARYFCPCSTHRTSNKLTESIRITQSFHRAQSRKFCCCLTISKNLSVVIDRDDTSWGKIIHETFSGNWTKLIIHNCDLKRKLRKLLEVQISQETQEIIRISNPATVAKCSKLQNWLFMHWTCW